MPREAYTEGLPTPQCLSHHWGAIRASPGPSEGRSVGVMSIEDRARTWIVGGDTGTSSETIWAVMMGAAEPKDSWRRGYPLDPDDFGRCYRLLKLIPEWRERLPEVAARYPTWRFLVQNWTLLTRMYVLTVNSGGRRAPKMYDLMQACIEKGVTP